MALCLFMSFLWKMDLMPGAKAWMGQKEKPLAASLLLNTYTDDCGLWLL